MDEQDKEIWAWTIGLIGVIGLGVPALGFVSYWFVALFKFGWGLASGL
jgi:hypothetical protein